MDDTLDRTFEKIIQKRKLLSEFVLARLREGQKKCRELGRQVTLFALASETGLLSKKQADEIGDELERLASGAPVIKKSAENSVGRSNGDDDHIKPDVQRVISAEPLGDELPSIAAGAVDRATKIPGRLPEKRRKETPRKVPSREIDDDEDKSESIAPIKMLIGLVGAIVLLGAIAVTAVFVYRGGKEPVPVDKAKLAFDELQSRLAVEKMDDEKRLKIIQTFRRRFPTSDFSGELEPEVKEIEERIRRRAVDRMASKLVSRAGLAVVSELPAVRADIRTFMKANPGTRHGARLLGVIKEIDRKIASAELESKWRAFKNPIDKLVQGDRFGDAFATLDAGKEFSSLKRAKDFREELGRLGKRRYQELSASARNKAGAGDFNGAIAVYEEIARKFGLPEYVEQSKKDLATIREGAKKKLIDNFTGAEKANRNARLACLEGKIKEAVKHLDDFTKSAPEAPESNSIRTRSRMLALTPAFAKAVTDGLEQLVGKKFTVKKAAGIKFVGKVLRADEKSFDIKVQGRTMTVKWDELAPGQIMRLGVGAYPGAMLEAWQAAVAWLIAKGDLEAARSHLVELQEVSTRTAVAAWIDDWQEDALLYKPTRLFFGRKELKMEGSWQDVTPACATCDGRGALTVTFPAGAEYRFSVSVRSLEPRTKFSLQFPAGKKTFSLSVEDDGNGRLSDSAAGDAYVSVDWELTQYEAYHLEIRVYARDATGFLDGKQVWKVKYEKGEKENPDKISLKMKTGRLEVSNPVLTQYRILPSGRK